MSLNNIPRSRTLFVASRASGAEIVGAVRIKPGERLAYAIEFKEQEIPLGGLLYCGDDNPFTGPAIGGADAADMEVEGYGIHDTQARFEVALDEEANTSGEIYLDFDVPVSSTELAKVRVSVVIVSAT